MRAVFKNIGFLSAIVCLMWSQASFANRPPVVDAGEDIVTYNSTCAQPNVTVPLLGRVVDDGLPAGNKLVSTWSTARAGQYLVRFGESTSPKTTAYFMPGGHLLTLTATDGVSTRSDTIRVNVVQAACSSPVPIANKLLLNDLSLPISLERGMQSHFSITIPAGASNLNIRMTSHLSSINGPDGDADLYVRFGRPPTTAIGDYDCRPNKPRYINEECFVRAPQHGTYYIMVNAFGSDIAGVSIVASFTPRQSSPPNQAPIVNAGSDFTVYGRCHVPLGETYRATLNGQVSDDGLPVGSHLVSIWTGNATFDDVSNLQTGAFLGTRGGALTLTLTASDSGGLTSSDTVNFNLFPAPCPTPTPTPTLYFMNSLTDADRLTMKLCTVGYCSQKNCGL